MKSVRGTVPPVGRVGLVSRPALPHAALPLVAVMRRLGRVARAGVLALIPGLVGAAQLSVVDRTLLIEAKVMGKETATVFIATRDGAGAAVAGAVAKAGGHVVSRQDDIDYLLAELPVDGVQGFARRADVVALQVAVYPVRGEAGPDDRPAPADHSKKSAPPGPWLQPDNPYTGEAATQAAQFKLQHPDWAGRGVTLGFVEPADPTLPSMHGALDGQGHAQPKYVDFDIGSPDHGGNPTDSSYGVLWQNTEIAHPTADGAVRIGEHTYQLPRDVQESQWRWCVRLPKPDAWDNTDHVILWGVSTRKVWVVPASAKDFAAAAAAEVRAPYFVMPIGQRNADTSDKISLTWVMKVDERGWKIGVAPTYARHPAMVASVMAGANFLGSAAGGVAPAARLAVFAHGWPDAPSADTFESQLAMLRSREVDVAESSASVGDTSRATSSVFAVLEGRLQRRTLKPFAKSAGNFGPRRGGIREMVAAADTFAIGGYVPGNTWKANFGYEPSAADTPAEYTGWGPADDGALKPDFLALTHTLDESEYASTGYDTPYGLYGVSGGTSAAAPNGAGLIALLVSAAKQTGVAHDIARLRAALATTAKFLPDIEARVQGRGLIQVSDAWAALRRATHWDPPGFVIKAPLVGAEREGGGSHREGVGLFEMGGWAPGQAGERSITIVRVSGPATPIVYPLRWHEGVSHAFSSRLSQIELPLNRPVELPVSIHVGAAGSYSAIVDLIDPSVGLVAASIMSTVLVGEPLSADRGYATKLVGELQRPGNAVGWVEVPKGLGALNVRVHRDDGGAFRLMVQDPTGRLLPYDLYGSSAGQESAAVDNGGTVLTLAAPVPGLWQFWFSERSNQIKPSAERLRAVPWQMEFRGIQVVAADAVTATAAADGTRSFQATFSNDGSDLSDARIEGLGLGSAHEEVLAFHSEEEPAKLFTVDVPPGADRLQIEADVAGDESARVGLYVYRKPQDPAKLIGDKTALVYLDPACEPRKTYTLRHPPPGEYVIAVDPVSVPAAGVSVRYRDVYFSPVFGTVGVHDERQLLRAHALRSAVATVAVGAVPTGDRTLVASVGVIDSLIGDSRVTEKVAENRVEEPVHKGKPGVIVVPVPLAQILWAVPTQR